jgi:hypothetical protein
MLGGYLLLVGALALERVYILARSLIRRGRWLCLGRRRCGRVARLLSTEARGGKKDQAANQRDDEKMRTIKRHLP